MANLWIPPVNIPSFSGGPDYSANLYQGLSGIGDAVVANSQQKLAQADWEKGYARQLANDTLTQSNADRNYALDLKKYDAGLLGSQERYGTPVPFQRKDGSWGIGTLGKDGSFMETQFPEGTTYNPRVTIGNTGTVLQPLTVYGGQAYGAGQPIKVEDLNRQQEIGASSGKIAAALPQIQFTADRLVEGIDKLLKDPYLPQMTGPADQWLPNVTGNANRVQAEIAFVLGGTFLQAYNDLRGAGAITQQEGAAATAAYNKLSITGVNDPDYIDNLNEFRNQVLQLLDVAKQRAAMGTSGDAPAAPGASPAGQPDADGLIIDPVN